MRTVPGVRTRWQAVWLVIAIAAAVLVPGPTAGAAKAKPAWSGEPTWIGGTARYDAGEWVYQDFVYDDGLRANNAADIVHVRVREVGDGLAVQLTLNSMIDPSSVVVGVALSGPDDPTRAWPFGAGVSSNWGRFLTITQGTVWESTGDGQPVAVADASIDPVANTVDVDIALPDPTQPVIALNIGAGSWDATAHGWTADGVIDLAFNRHELEPVPLTWPAGEYGPLRNQNQQGAINNGDVSLFDHAVDREVLRSRHVDAPITEPGPKEESGDPPTGAPVAVPPWSTKLFPNYPGQKTDVINRVYLSMQDLAESYGPAASSGLPNPMAGRYQTYRITVPEGYAATSPRPLNLLLHASGFNHNANPTLSVTERMGDDLGAFTLTPLALGPSGGYRNQALVDTLQALADVQRHYAVDRERISVSGYSMGGGGVWRLTTLLPDLFTSGVIWAGTQAGLDQLENTQYTPIMVIHGSNDELVTLNRVLPYTDRLHELGYDYRFNLHPGLDHLAFMPLDDWTRERDWVGGRRRTVNPGNVTLNIAPSEWASGPGAERILADLREVAGVLGSSIDGAYWVDDVVVVDGQAMGSINLTSHAIGPRVPVRNEILTPMPGPPTPYVQRGISRVFADAPTANQLSGTLAGVSELTIDVERAGLSLKNLSVDITTDRAVTVHLRAEHQVRTIGIEAS